MGFYPHDLGETNFVTVETEGHFWSNTPSQTWNPFTCFRSGVTTVSLSCRKETKAENNHKQKKKKTKKPYQFSVVPKLNLKNKNLLAESDPLQDHH